MSDSKDRCRRPFRVQRIAKLNPDGTIHYYLTDHLGSTRVLFGSDWNANYHAFGEVAEQTGSEVENKYGFSGKEHDSGAGLRYYGWRYYDPQLGRWLTVDPAEQGWSPYAYAGNRPVLMVDQDGRIAWFVPIIIGAVIGGTTGGIVAHNNGQEWWKGANVGGFVGALGGSIVSSAIGATGVGGSAFGTFTTAINSANFNMIVSGAGEAWKAGLVGFGTSLFNTSGAFGLVKRGFFGRLGYQGLSTSLGSIGQNWVYGNDLLSEITWGVGPVNLTFGKGQRLLQAGNIWGNIVTNTLGLSNAIFGGGVKFHWKHLAFEYFGGPVGKVGKWLTGGGWTGAYSIIGDVATYDDYFPHELHHIWQSRAFVNSFLPLWALGGLQSVIAGRNFNDPASTFNYFEQQVLGGYPNRWRF